MMSLHMLTHTGHSKKNGAAVLEYLKATEYYVDAQGSTLSSSRWWGKGAEALRLNGVVEALEMDQLARGFAPDGTTKLVQNAGSDKHRVGCDTTFSAPKSVSVIYAAADEVQREQLRQAQTAAVNAALNYLQSRVETRRGKAGCEHLDVSGLVVSQHMHFGSRALDAQMHVHCLVYNVALGEDGKWGALDNHEIARNIRSAGALYRAELAHQLQQLGYGIEQQRERDSNERETGQVYFEVVGVDAGLCDRMSKRRQAIEAYAEEHDVTFDEACLITRPEKNEPSYEDLVKEWSGQLEQERAQHPSIFKSVDALRGLGDRLEPESATHAQILERLHLTNAVFSTPELVERLALESVGRKSAAEILKDMEAFQQAPDLHRIQGQEQGGGVHHSVARKHREQRYSADWMVEMEQEVNRRALERHQDPRGRVSPEAFEAAVARFQSKGIELSQEQLEAARFTACESGGTVCITGRAGAGKTMSSALWIDAFRAEGFNIIGCSTSWDAANKLAAEAGIEAFATTKLLGDLDAGKTKLSPRDVVVLDEAGMVGTKTMLALQRHCDQAGSRLVAVGDNMQLQPIEAGSPFRIAIEAVGDKQLTEIRRQKDEQDRETAKLYYSGKKGRGAEESMSLGRKIYERLDKNGHLVKCESPKAAIEKTADLYCASSLPASEKLVIASTRPEVAALNRAIRGRLMQRGEVSQDSKVFTANNGRTFEQMPVALGDRVRFGKRDKDMGISNGSGGVVTDVRTTAKGSLILAVRLESDIPSDHGRIVRFDTGTYKHLAHNYAGTVHKSQGQGRQQVFHLANSAMADNQSALVAFTRSKGKRGYQLVGTEETLGELRSKLGLERLKENATDRLAQSKTKAQEHGREGAEKGFALTARQKVLQSMEEQWEKFREGWAPVAERLQQVKAGVSQVLARQRRRDHSQSMDI